MIAEIKVYFMHLYVKPYKIYSIGVCLKMIHSQTIDKHNAMIFFPLSPFTEEAEDPACNPVFWISKWVDYSDKYGLGKTPC